jgi:nonsense-mediated mRNA decay protein 3
LKSQVDITEGIPKSL